MAYPLAKIDTINEETGDLNENSALNLVVSGDNIQHLDMLDGLLEDLLEAKWESFAKRRSAFLFGKFKWIFLLKLDVFSAGILLFLRHFLDRLHDAPIFGNQLGDNPRQHLLGWQLCADNKHNRLHAHQKLHFTDEFARKESVE